MEKNQHTNFHVWFLSCSVHSTGCRTFCPTDPTAIDIDPYGYGKILYSKTLFQFCKVYHPLCIRLQGKSLFDHHNILANHIRALQAYKKSNKTGLKRDLNFVTFWDFSLQRSKMYLHKAPGVLGLHVVKSQHSPVAHVALGKSVQVSGLQQGLSQWSLRPQSHSSPGSTKLFPQTGESKSLTGLFLRQQSMPENDKSTINQ